jgi:sphinganine-1-phosphate aldolase
MNSYKLPKEGSSAEQILSNLQSFKSQDVPWATGRAFAYVYEPPADAKAVISQAFVSYLSENVLDPTSFPSLLKMERDVISIVANVLGGDSQTVGNITAGGTESIILALKSARDYFRDKKNPTATPEVILACTAHAAFFKACHYLGLKPVLVPVNPQNFQIETDKIAALINENTAIIVASAPNYSHGVADDVVAIGQIAKQYNIFFHVDACVGGFYLPFARRLGANIPPFSLEVEGVSSISCDLHKYGYTFKSVSVILYKSAVLRQYQIYTCSDWSGYSIINPTVASSKSGASLAGAWACLHYFGEEGYLKLNTLTQGATQQFINGVKNIPNLEVLGEPVMNLVAVVSHNPVVSVFQLADILKRKGWYIQTQLASMISPETLHLNINPANAQWVADLLKDLQQAVEELLAANQALPVFDMNWVAETLSQPEGIMQIFQLFGSDGGSLPDDFVLINNFLNQLQPQHRNILLTYFTNNLFVAS